jgi:hypothetical protein
MKLLQLAAIAGFALALSAGAASAQYSATPPSSGAKTDSMTTKPSGKVSNSDMKRMKACNAMSQSAMMKDTGCVKMMKAHPEMMKSGGSSTTSDSMTPRP